MNREAEIKLSVLKAEAEIGYAKIMAGIASTILACIKDGRYKEHVEDAESILDLIMPKASLFATGSVDAAMESLPDGFWENPNYPTKSAADLRIEDLERENDAAMEKIEQLSRALVDLGFDPTQIK